MNKWQKRLTTELECPSGNTATVRRPGPDMMLKLGKVLRILQRNKSEVSNIDAQLAFLETLSDEDILKLTAFARPLLVDVVVEPKLSLNPQGDELTPDDLPLADFWFIYTWAMNGGPTMPVKLKEGETTVETVETFPAGQGGSAGLSDDGEIIQ